MRHITPSTTIFDPETYTVRDPFGEGWEGEVAIAKIKPEKEKPIGIAGEMGMGYVTTDVFVEDVELHPRYDVGDTSSGESGSSDTTDTGDLTPAGEGTPPRRG